MANDKSFKIKNGLQAGRYLQSAGVETAGSEGYNLAGASYDSVSFSVASQETTPRAVFFKTDGTKMYVVGTTNDTVYQYTLSTAWDVSTASYESKSLSVSAQDINPLSIFFKPDGTRMYMQGASNDDVYQYSLTTAWDISTASYDSISFDGSTQDVAMYGVFFKDDGTKMYLNGYANGGDLYQYSLSTAWDLSTASYDTVSFDYSPQESSSVGLSFTDDGFSFFLLSDGTDVAYKYTMSTAWDISTASYDSSSPVFAEDTSILGFALGNSGNKFYMVGNTADTIYQYSTVGYTQTLDLSTGSYFQFTPSGATTVSFSNPPASGLATGFAVEINGDGSAITWPSSVKWPSGVAPTATASKEVYAFVTTDGGSTYYGKLAGSAIA